MLLSRAGRLADGRASSQRQQHRQGPERERRPHANKFRPSTLAEADDTEADPVAGLPAACHLPEPVPAAQASATTAPPPRAAAAVRSLARSAATWPSQTTHLTNERKPLCLRKGPFTPIAGRCLPAF